MGNLLTVFSPKYGCQCDPLTAHGETFSRFFGEYLGICLYTSRDQIGYTVGLLNLLVVSTVQWPQVYHNFRRGRCDDLSLVMLLAWNFADISGALGLLFQGQTRTTAWIQQLYCTSVDIILTCQWFYYNCIANRKRKQVEEETNDDDPFSPLLTQSPDSSSIDGAAMKPHHPNNSTPQDSNIYSINSNSGVSTTNRSIAPSSAPTHNQRRGTGGGSGGVRATRDPLLFPLIAILGLSLISHVVEATIDFSPQTATDLGTVLLCEDPAPASTRTQEVLGYLFAFMCSAIYIASQFPQIYSNWKTKTAEAVAPASLVICIVNYFFYSIALLTPTKYSDGHRWGAPFWLGLGPYLFAILCCTMTCSILLAQRYIYAKKPDTGVDVDDEIAIGINSPASSSVLVDHFEEMSTE